MPASELLVVGYGTREHIRRNALQHLHQEITLKRKSGETLLFLRRILRRNQAHFDLGELHPFL